MLKLTLTIAGKQITVGDKSCDYLLFMVDGLDCAEIEQNAVPHGGMHGMISTGARYGAREITIEARGKESVLHTIEKRHALIDFFRVDQNAHLLVELAGRKRQVTCRVLKPTVPLDTKGSRLRFMVVLTCHYPLFAEVNSFHDNMAHTSPLLASPFAVPFGAAFTVEAKRYQDDLLVVNRGVTNVGFTATITALDEVENPALVRVATLLDGNEETTHIGYSGTLHKGDIWTICTVPRQIATAVNGQNAMASLKAGSSFFHLLTGDNVLRYTPTGLRRLKVDIHWNYEHLGV